MSLSGSYRFIFETLKADSPVLLYLSIGMLSANLLFRLQLFVPGQLAYQSNHPDLPMKTIALFMMANTINFIFVLIILIGMGGVSVFLGYEFSIGFNLVGFFSQAEDYANQIPILIKIPLILAFFVTYMVQVFFHY